MHQRAFDLTTIPETKEALADLAKEKFRLELLIGELIAMYNRDDVRANADKIKAAYDNLKKLNPREEKMLSELDHLRIEYYNQRHYRKLLQYPDRVVDAQQTTKDAYQNATKQAIKNIREKIDGTKRNIEKNRNRILSHEAKLAVENAAPRVGSSYIRLSG